MVLSERLADRALILAPAGRIDMTTSDQFRERLLPLVDDCVKKGWAVILDFSAVEYISSAGLRVLMLAAKQARASGQTVAVAALQPVVLEIFQISRFDKMLPCYPGVSEALASVAPSAQYERASECISGE